MIDNFLRLPRGAGEVTADLVRVAGLVSVVVAAIWWTPTDAGVLAFTLPGLLLPRFVGVRPWFDILYGVTLLAAAWSNVFDLYTRFVGWDLVVHFLATAVLAAVMYLALSSWRIVPDPCEPGFRVAAGVVLTTTLGLAISALWEMVEWIGYTFITDEIFVTYDDTIGDMASGGLGALAAGVLLSFVPLLSRRSEG